MTLVFDSFQFHELLLCLGIVYVAAVLQMSVGMGFGMLASPLVALIKPEIVPASIMIVGLVVAFSGAWRERNEIDFKELQLGVGGRVIGSAAAFGVLLTITDTKAFLLVFGVLTLLAVLITAGGTKFVFNHMNLLALSVVSGLMGTITAVGAPPMAIIYHNRPPELVRPTLNAFFASGCILGLISLAASGWLRQEAFFAAVLFLPAMILGIYSSRFFRGLSAKWLSRILLCLSGIAALMLIAQGLA